MHTHAPRHRLADTNCCPLMSAYLPCHPCALQHPPLETITQPGEVMYVPRGWWHMVLNLDESVAVTHNYVSSQGLPAVLRFLKPGRETLVSGCCLQDRCVSGVGGGWELAACRMGER